MKVTRTDWISWDHADMIGAGEEDRNDAGWQCPGDLFSCNCGPTHATVLIRVIPCPASIRTMLRGIGTKLVPIMMDQPKRPPMAIRDGNVGTFGTRNLMGPK